MGVPITVNRYSCPTGYRQYANGSFGAGNRYLPFNGFIAAGNPGVLILGPTQQLTIAAVVPDLSTLTLVDPNGKGTVFQFVYNASVQSTGIKVPLPLSGASTAAQTAAALLAVLSQKFGVDFAGVTRFFNWTASAVSATQIAINWKVAGTNSAPELPANITNLNTAAQGFGTGSVNPGIQGKTFSFLPG